MSKRKVTARAEIHEGSGNVYRDLGYADAEEMLVKAQLVSKIREIIRDKGLTQLAAARILGLPQPKLSGILRGQFRGVSERKLIDCLTRLGRDVEIVVKDAARRRTSAMGVGAGSISSRPSRSRISSARPPARPRRSRSAFGATTRPAASMVVFMAGVYPRPWTRHAKRAISWLRPPDSTINAP